MMVTTAVEGLCVCECVVSGVGSRSVLAIVRENCPDILKVDWEMYSRN